VPARCFPASRCPITSRKGHQHDTHDQTCCAGSRPAAGRLPVTDTELAYLQDAFWVDRPARLFGQLVAETIRSQNGRVVVDGDDPGLNAADRLHGSLRAFGYDARTREVVVVFDAVRNGAGASAISRRFEARVPVAAPETEFVGPALNQAANQVAGEIADWLN
jgi:cholesterol transport system auxiliary component